jgi:hypothetical protein
MDAVTAALMAADARTRVPARKDRRRAGLAGITLDVEIGLRSEVAEATLA